MSVFSGSVIFGLSSLIIQTFSGIIRNWFYRISAQTTSDLRFVKIVAFMSCVSA